MARIKMGGTNRQYALLAVLVVVAVAIGFYQLRQSGAGGPGAAAAGGVEFTPHQVPQLLAWKFTPGPERTSDGIRNPFVYGSPPTPTPNLTPRPTLPPRPTLVPRPTPTPNTIHVGGRELPPPPPFDRDYIGYFGPKHRFVAVFRKGKNVGVAVAGDVIADTYVLRKVGLESVTIGFVGYPEEVTTRVPLAKK